MLFKTVENLQLLPVVYSKKRYGSEQRIFEKETTKNISQKSVLYHLYSWNFNLKLLENSFPTSQYDKEQKKQLTTHADKDGELSLTVSGIVSDEATIEIMWKYSNIEKYIYHMTQQMSFTKYSSQQGMVARAFNKAYRRHRKVNLWIWGQSGLQR